MRDKTQGMFRGQGKTPGATAYCPEGRWEGET